MGERVGRVVAAGAAAAWLALGGVAAGGAEEANRALYLQYCGACHGPEGRGDGIAGTFFRPKPTDLTQIAKRNGGEFPYLRTMEAIDGRNTVRAHGDPTMPVWGELFQEQAAWTPARRAEARGKIMMITEHLRSIQER
jgi:mono/diheme cytochrome c family protein